jgi:hypothetical protein
MFAIVTLADAVMAKCKDGTLFDIVFPFTNEAEAELAMVRANQFVADHAAGKVHVNKAKWNDTFNFGKDQKMTTRSSAEIPRGSKAFEAKLNAAAAAGVQDAIERENKVSLAPTAIDISTISEYGLTQKLSNSIRCF